MNETMGGVEQDLAEFRELVRDRPQIADRAAAASRKRADVLAARFDLLAALAAFASDPSDDGSVRAALDRLRPIAPPEGPVTVELVVGLVVTNRLSEALAQLSATLNTPQPGLSVADVRGWLGFVRHLQRNGQSTGNPAAALTALLTQLTQVLAAAVGTSSLRAVVNTFAGEPESADAPAVLRAQLALSRGDADESLTALDTLPPQAGATPLAVATRVRALIAAGQPEQAAAAATEALAATPDDVGLLLAASEALAASGHNDDALQTLERAEEHASGAELRAVRARRGMLLCADPATRADGIAVLQGVTADPQAAVDPALSAVLAEALYQSDRADEGLAEVDRALLGDAADAQLHWLRARLLRERGRNVEALASVEEAGRIDPNRAEFSELRAEVLEVLGRYGEAASWYGQVIITAGPGDELAQVAQGRLAALANTLFDERKFEDALAAVDVLRDRGLLTGDLMALRAELLRLVARYAEAIEQADAAVSILADHANVVGTRAQSLVSLSRSGEALTAIDAVLAADPGNLFAWSVRVEANAELGELTAALAIMDEHFPLDSLGDDWRPWRISLTAWYLSLLGRDDEAERIFDVNTPERRAEALAMLKIRVPGHEDEALRLFAEIRDTTASSSVRLDYADALSLRGELPPEAMSIYQSLAIRSSQYETPTERAERCWAAFRSGKSPDSALRTMHRALEQATDPLPFESSKAAVLAACSSTPQDATALLQRTVDLCRQVERGPDAGFAIFIRNDLRFLVELTESDSRFKQATPHLDELQRQLGPG